MTFQELCLFGESADAFCLDRKYDAAEKIYLDIIKELEESKKMDLFVISKAVLGLLYTYVKSENYNKAFDLWTGQTENSPIELGLMGIEETFQTSSHDAMTYYLLCSFLISITSEEKDEIAKQISFYMNNVMDYALESEKEMIPLAINNWMKHLIYIFKGNIPKEYTDEIKNYEKKIGSVESIEDIYFPALSKWIIDWKEKLK